ncbi:MAG: GNAT family protein [Pseudomonadota bacterium]
MTIKITQKITLDKDYVCIGKNLMLYRYQPYFTHFIYSCYQHREFIENYCLNDSFIKDEKILKQDLLKKQSLPPQMLKSMEWVICIKKTGEEIGLAGLVNYNAVHQSAEFLIGILPGIKQPQQSYGPEASLLVLEFAFQEIQLHKLTSLVYGYNHKAQQSTLKLGFIQEGILRHHLRDNRQSRIKDKGKPSSTEKYIDIFYNGLLKSEFYSNKKLSQISLRLFKRDITRKTNTNTKKKHILTETLIPDLLKQLRSANPHESTSL